jgi:Rnl2 family RNA ligase
MRFRMFPKIPSHRAAPPRAVGGPWVALEKLHGAQLVVGVDAGGTGGTGGATVHVGKRKAWLAPDEPFFGWQLLAAELTAAARAIARATGAAQTVLYGELIGGGYPHPDVPPVPGLSPVQTGIWYTPALAWVLFDALVAAGDDDEHGELLAYRELEELAGAAGVRTAPRLARGTRAELERVEVRFPTRVPAWLGLPPLPDNLAEGVVLRPDARGAPADRPVIKRKLPEFDDERFREAEGWDPGHLTEAELLAWVDRMVQPARLASARSKVGADPAAVADEVALDVAIDLGLAFRDAWAQLPAAAQERILARAREQARRRLAGPGA